MNVVLMVVAIIEAIVIAVVARKLLKIKYDGAVVITETEEKKTFSLEEIDPDVWDQKRTIVLKVSKISKG